MTKHSPARRCTGDRSSPGTAARRARGRLSGCARGCRRRWVLGDLATVVAHGLPVVPGSLECGVEELATRLVWHNVESPGLARAGGSQNAEMEPAERSCRLRVRSTASWP